MLASSLPNHSNSRPLEGARRTENQRLTGIDILRYFSFLAILIFHLTYAFWAPHGLEQQPFQGLWSQPFEQYARAFAFSGFSILLLSFFLFGFKESRKLRFLISILSVFFVVWSIVSWDYPYFWDIYPYLISVLLLLAMVRKLRIPPLVLIFSGAAITSIPFWQLEGVFALPAWLEPAL